MNKMYTYTLLIDSDSIFMIMFKKILHESLAFLHILRAEALMALLQTIFIRTLYNKGTEKLWDTERHTSCPI